jgi:hypothetical protein
MPSFFTEIFWSQTSVSIEKLHVCHEANLDFLSDLLNWCVEHRGCLVQTFGKSTKKTENILLFS